MMKHIILPYIFYVLLLRSSFCLGLPQLNTTQNNHNGYNQIRKFETTTAEPPKNMTPTTPHIIKNNASTTAEPPKSMQASTITSISWKNLDTTISTYDDGRVTEKMHNNYSTEPNTSGMMDHSIKTTTAVPMSTALPSLEGGFDFTSFLGGCLIAFSVTVIAFVLWCTYKIQIERSYHTI